MCIQPPKVPNTPLSAHFQARGYLSRPLEHPESPVLPGLQARSPPNWKPPSSLATDLVRRAPTAILCPVFVLGNFTAIFYSLAALEAVCKCGVEKGLHLTEPDSQGSHGAGSLAVALARALLTCKKQQSQRAGALFPGPLGAISILL